MRNVLLAIVCFLLSVTGGIIGSALWGHFKEKNDSSLHSMNIQARRLELVDSTHKVKAVFAAEDDGQVYLKMLSNNNVPVVDLSVDKVTPWRKEQPQYTSGRIILRNDYKIPIIDMREVDKGDGQISFSNTATHDQVIVGYDNAECLEGPEDDEMWGVRIRDADHSSKSLVVFTHNGTPKRGGNKLEPPPKIKKMP